MAGNYRHGYFGTPTYKSWSEMKHRCNKPQHSRYENTYKNVSYCKEWEEFTNFLNDMGERPENTTLDRIDPFGNYCKENCRWANWVTQENNRTNNKKYYIDNELLTIPQIAKKYNISRSNLANKVYIYKWDIYTAIQYLVNKKGGDFYGRA